MGLKRAILCLLLLLAAGSARAQDVDVKEIVFDHLGDSYGWHICTVGETHVTLPLPVIVRGMDGGWHVFSSSRLPYAGFEIAAEGEHKGKIVEGGVRPLDLSLTKNALAIMINCAVLLLVILPLARWYRGGRMDAPGGVRGTVELLIEYIDDEVITPCVGDDHRKYAPYLLTVFFFIFLSNLMGLIPIFPAGANVTGNIAVTAFLALCTFLVVNFSGTKEYWKEILWPDVPTWLKAPAPIMPVIEIVGIFTKPFALMIRLFANIFAGHAVVIGLVCVVFITVKMGVQVNRAMSLISVLFGIFMLCLELLVAFIQAYVFTLLSSVFIGMARVKHEHK